MASLEGPAHVSDQAAASRGLPEAPPLTPERAQQELAKLADIINNNEPLNFLEPRVKRCQESGSADLATLLSFYRLVSQSLAEELGSQKEALQSSTAALAQAKQTSAQAAMQAALDEASVMVTAKSRGETAPPPSSAGAVMSEEGQAKLEQAEKQIERLMQDMQNMRNRAKIDIEVRVFKELEKFCHSLLPALDAFYQAMPSLKSTVDISSIVTGVTMIHEQLQDSLEKAGLKRLQVVGQPFDPRFHEAIGEVPTSDIADDHIYDELQPGYLLGERLIRAAMVRIARNDGPPPAPAQPAPVAQAPPSPPTPPAAPAQAAPVAAAPTAPAQPAPVAQAPAAPPAPQAPAASLSPPPQAAPQPQATTPPEPVPQAGATPPASPPPAPPITPTAVVAAPTPPVETAPPSAPAVTSSVHEETAPTDPNP